MILCPPKLIDSLPSETSAEMTCKQTSRTHFLYLEGLANVMQNILKYEAKLQMKRCSTVVLKLWQKKMTSSTLFFSYLEYVHKHKNRKNVDVDTVTDD